MHIFMWYLPVVGGGIEVGNEGIITKPWHLLICKVLYCDKVP